MFSLDTAKQQEMPVCAIRLAKVKHDPGPASGKMNWVEGFSGGQCDMWYMCTPLTCRSNGLM